MVPLHQSDIGPSRSSNQAIFPTAGPPRSSNHVNVSSISSGSAQLEDLETPNWAYTIAKRKLKEVNKSDLPENISQYLAIEKALQTLLDSVRHADGHSTAVILFWQALAAITEANSAPERCFHYSLQLEKSLAALRREYEADGFSLSGTDFVLVDHATPFLISVLDLCRMIRNEASIRSPQTDGRVYAALLHQQCAEVVTLMKASRWADLVHDIPP
jgi:hypothetical protein